MLELSVVDGTSGSIPLANLLSGSRLYGELERSLNPWLYESKWQCGLRPFLPHFTTLATQDEPYYEWSIFAVCRPTRGASILMRLVRHDPLFHPTLITKSERPNW